MLSHSPEMGQYSRSKSAKNVLPSHKILRIQLAPEHQEVNITACTHQLRHIGKIIQTRCSRKTPQHSLWILGKAEKHWTMKTVNAWPLAHWLDTRRAKSLCKINGCISQELCKIQKQRMNAKSEVPSILEFLQIEGCFQIFVKLVHNDAWETEATLFFLHIPSAN